MLVWAKNGLDSRVSTLDAPQLPTTSTSSHAATPRPADDAGLLLDSRARNCNRMHPRQRQSARWAPAGFQLGSICCAKDLNPAAAPVTTAFKCNNRRKSLPAPRLSLRVWFNVTSTFKHGPRRGYSAGLANVAPRFSWQPSSPMLALVGQIGFIPVGSHIRPPLGLSVCRPVGPEKTHGGGWLGGGIESTFPQTAVTIYRACASPFSQVIAPRRDGGDKTR